MYCCGCRYRTTLQLTLFERGGARSTLPAEPSEGPHDHGGAAAPSAEAAPSPLEYVARQVRRTLTLRSPLARDCLR